MPNSGFKRLNKTVGTRNEASIGVVLMVHCTYVDGVNASSPLVLSG
jgi:hypothetical protein